MIGLWIEEDTNLLRSKVEGFLSLADVKQYERQLDHVSREVRNKAGRVRFLIDSTAASVQSPDVAAALRQVPSVLLLPEDRLAVVVGDSALKKMQTERMMRDDREQMFSSEQEARAWLQE
jgi:hypothetical protein